MFGNRLGWVISLVLAAGMLWMLYSVAMPPQVTPTTNSSKLTVARTAIALPMPASSVVTPGSKSENAGDYYLKVIEDYQVNHGIYESFRATGGVMKIREKDMPAVDWILKVRDCGNCTIFSRDLPKVVNYDNRHPSIEDLADAGDICCTVGKLNLNEKYGQMNPEHAVKLWEAAFELGRHMYEERVCWDELVRGHGVMQTAAINLRDYYKDQKDPRGDAIEKFVAGENDYQKKITDAFQIIGAIDETYAGQYAGDILSIATARGNYTASDRMFRVEALKHVGNYLYNSKSKGDQLAARKVLAQMIDQPGLSPDVKAAANAAHDLTLAKHNMVGGSE